jgi:hypothetical protein
MGRRMTVNIKRVLIILTVLLLLAAAPIGLAATSGDDETDVVDITKDKGVEKAQPGQNNVVVQVVKVEDAGSKGDENEDGFDTAIETITIKKVTGSTLENRFIRKIKLYLDNDNKGKFEAIKDFLLGEVSNPDLTNGVTFGTTGSLLTNVEDNGKAIFFVVMDFADDAPDGATLRTSFDLTVSDSLIGGPTISSGLDPAAFPPVLRGSGEPAYFFLRITSTTGNDETDIIEETPATTATPGDLVVLQQFTIADPGPTGDADGDGNPTLVRNITVKKISGTADTTRIQQLMLYKESSATPPGFQEEDQLLGVINNPNLDAGVVFHNNGRRLLRVADKSEERLYIVAQLAPVGFEDGDTLQTEVSVVAKDDPDEPGAEDSSGIETPMPVIASNFLTIEVPPPTIFIGACQPLEVGGPCDKLNPYVELKPTEQGTIYIAVRYVPEPGLGEFQIGPEGAIIYDPNILEITAVKGVSPYRVEIYDTSIPGIVYFVASLKPGRKAINEGPVVELTVKPVEGVVPGTETELTIEDEFGIEMVDVFKDVDGKDLVPDIVPGKVEIKLLKGDVDGDSVVTASDARIVARFILGLERFTPEQREAADVAPPFGKIDVTDVRYIAQAAAGLRELDPASAGGISALALTPSKPSLLASLLHLLGFHPLSRAQMVASTNGNELVIASNGTKPIDIQGTLTFDPAVMQVEQVVGMNGYTILASQVDNDLGRVRFVASLIDGVPTGEAILKFEIQGRADDSLRLNFDLLRDSQGRDLVASVDYTTRIPVALSQVQARCNGRGIEFEALGVGIESIEVQIFNLAGVKIFDSGPVARNTLEWHLMNDQGKVVANGVYLYTVTVKGSDGRTLRSRIEKLLVLK